MKKNNKRGEMRVGYGFQKEKQLVRKGRGQREKERHLMDFNASSWKEEGGRKREINDSKERKEMGLRVCQWRRGGET